MVSSRSAAIAAAHTSSRDVGSRSQHWSYRPRRKITARPVTVCTRAGERHRRMSKSLSVVLYVLVLTIVVVGIDLMFFRNRFWERLIVNIGIVLVFAAFYLRFFRES